MKLIEQKGPFCLVASAAMVLDSTIEELHAEIGTDGTEIWWPPAHMRGIHIQEIQDCAIRRGRCLYCIEQKPYLAPKDDGEPILVDYKLNMKLRFMEALRFKRAILITDNHAVAWDGNLVYDPKGFLQSFDQYTFYEAWILGRLI